ncbi:MAG: DUF424 domain-containing protein [Promethearchaeota archaeon]
MKVFLKIHRSIEGEVVAACDQEILGKVLRDSNLTVNISEAFYGGNLMEIDTAIDILKNTTNFNIVGKNIVEYCINNHIIPKEGVIKIEGIPFAMKFIF